MVDADAVVSRPCAGLVIPERILVVLLVEHAEGIGVAEVDELPVFLAAGQHEEGVVFPHRGVVAIAGFGDDVVIAAQHHGPVRRQQPARMGDQPVAPVELVRIFFGIDRISVG